MIRLLLITGLFMAVAMVCFGLGRLLAGKCLRLGCGGLPEDSEECSVCGRQKSPTKPKG